MPLILDGRKAREDIQHNLKEKIEALKIADKAVPCVAIIQVGSRADSNAYIHQKKLFADAIGARVIHICFKEEQEKNEKNLEENIIQEIVKYNRDESVHGILVQLPIPAHLNTEKIIETIDYKKDIDGLTAHNTKLLFSGHSEKSHIPATARAIIGLLDYYKIHIAGSRVVVVGRSNLVGKPTALAFLNRDATVTIAHKETVDLGVVTATADILVIAIGDPCFINSQYISSNSSKKQVVVDVGINLVDKKLVGDVDYEDVKDLVAAISPVPGGVGPMTVASLFQNLIDAYDII